VCGNESPPRFQQYQIAVIITLNGQPRELTRPLVIAELLKQLEISTRGVAVEVNHELVPRSRHAEQLVADGDRLEIVTLVGGG
jgi:sulfur carrier protein